MDAPSNLETIGLNEGSLDIPCQQCNRKFFSERSLRCHVKVHNDKILKCCFCEQKFNRTDTLFLHTLDHITKGTLPCKAEGCDAQVNSMSEGEQHANLEHSNDGVPTMKCEECSECLSSFRKMLYHHTFKHGALKEYADEMTAKQKEFLRIKKNQSRKEKKPTNENSLGVNIEKISEIKTEEDFSQHGYDNDNERIDLNEEDNHNSFVEQLKIAMNNTIESNTEMIGKLSDVIAELFPLIAGEQYQCLHCMLGFTDAILWMTHLAYHDVEHPFKCSGCRRQFENRQTFVLHLTYFAHEANFKVQN
uniref:C2H2-type domain-containing protein n=1 Tax=Caenorhabditis tropicalis TaxID=1561998 RepID=A0A1I7TEJ5_9PELO